MLLLPVSFDSDVSAQKCVSVPRNEIMASTCEAEKVFDLICFPQLSMQIGCKEAAWKSFFRPFGSVGIVKTWLEFVKEPALEFESQLYIGRGATTFTVNFSRTEFKKNFKNKIKPSLEFLHFRYLDDIVRYDFFYPKISLQ